MIASLLRDTPVAQRLMNSLLKTAEQLLGLPYLGHAGDPSVTSMSEAFNLIRHKH
jgi:hypothetical protein